MLQGRWQVRLLGGLEARQAGLPPIKFPSQKSALLFARLATSPGRAFGRDELAELLWPDAAMERKRQSLRQALTSLRTVLEPTGIEPGSVLAADRVKVSLVREAVSCDLDDLAGAARSECQDLEEFRTAIARYAGELLPGYADDWVVEERRLAEELYMVALKNVSLALRRDGRIQDATIYAQRLVSSNPLDEDSQGLLIRLLAEAGRAEDAVTQYRQYRNLLRQEFGDAPDPKLTELVATLKGAKGALATEPMPSTPESLRNRSGLPVQLTRFFGRGRQLDEVTDHIAGPSPRRLVTLVGVGGAGKTRLALEVARRLEDSYSGRVWFVQLAGHTDPGLIVNEICDAVGIPITRSGSPLEQLVDAMGDVPAVFVLDNLEQLLPGAAQPIQKLLAATRRICLLCTSRRPLRLPGEEQEVVTSLELPAEDAVPEEVLAVPSVQMFSDRASCVFPSFRLSERNLFAVAELCRRLEGLPLAIELAAARSGSFQPREMVELISKRFELLQDKKLNKVARHASLWAAMDWSLSLLNPGSRELLPRLSVFRGGWDFLASEQVSECDGVLDSLEQLRLHSMIDFEADAPYARWSMPESIREFAEAHLPNERTLELRHARHYTAHSTRWHEQQRGGDQEAAIQLFAKESANLWAVIERAIGHGVAIEFGYQAANNMYRFLEMRGQWDALRRAYERLLEADTESRGTPERALALISLANLIRQQGQPERAIGPTEECLQIRKQLEDKAGCSSALGHLAQIYRALGDHARAKDLYLECLDIQEETGAVWSWAMNCMNLGWLLILEEDWAQAQVWLERSRASMSSLEDSWGVAAATGNLGEVAVGRGDRELACRLHADSLGAFTELEDMPAVAEELEAVAHLAWLSGKGAESARLFGAASALRKVIGSALSGQEWARLESRMALCRKDNENFDRDFEEGRWLGWREAADFALRLLECGTSVPREW